MNDILTVMKFTMKDMLKRKSFIISTIIILVMIVVGFNVPNIIKVFSDDDAQTRMFISDKDNVFEGNLDTLNSMNLGYEITIENATEENIKEKILNDEIDEGIIIERKDGAINLTYIVDNLLYSGGLSDVFIEYLTSLYQNIQINKLDLTQEEKASLTPVFTYELAQAEEEANGNVFVMMLMSIVLFYAIYFGALQISSSITTEKTSKIIETLVTSTSPRNIVIGKTIGIGIIGLFQLTLIIITALISANLFIDKEIISAVLDVTSITFGLGLITLLYFALGYLTYSLLYALTGSTVSKPEDIQSANTPVAIITLIGFYLSYFTMMNPVSDLNLFASLFPFSSPFCMPFRVMMGISSPLEVLLSVIILIITIFIIAKLTIKIYSNAILNYGTKMSFSDIIKMYKQK